MLKSLNPFATPFLNEGTMRAWVASLERSERFSLMVDFETTYWWSDTCRTSLEAAGAAGTGEPAGSRQDGRAAPGRMDSFLPARSGGARALSSSEIAASL